MAHDSDDCADDFPPELDDLAAYGDDAGEYATAAALGEILVSYRRRKRLDALKEEAQVALVRSEAARRAGDTAREVYFLRIARGYIEFVALVAEPKFRAPRRQEFRLQ